MPGRDGMVFETGIERLEKQHRELFHGAKQLQCTVEESRSADHLRKVLSELTVRMRAHFLDQELIMEGAEYPGLRDHRLSHAAFTEGLLRMQGSAGFRRAQHFLQIVRYELQWIVAHLEGEDTRFLQWLRTSESAAAMPLIVSDASEAPRML